uniref:UBA domain-containing protein n=1 Tax=Acrobeloides nanus TaxID=290746 RepID=A0A914EFC5_9BILA
MVNVTVFGTKEQEFPDVNVNQTIEELLNGLSLNGSDFGIIYYGRTLKRDQVISELPGLKPNHKLYIICQKAKVPETPVLLPTKAKEVAKECLYRLENLQPYEEEKDFRPLINRDMHIMNALNDFSCIKASIGEENFVTEHPNFAVIVKSMLDKIVVSIPTTSWFANQPGNAVRRQAPAMNASPLITPEMLRNALNVALLPTPPVQPNQNVATSGGGNAANQTQRNYAAQLEQLREFGFSDDNENLIALEACDGNVDQALELIITMRENPSDA